jgi:hypothetical protein
VGLFFAMLAPLRAQAPPRVVFKLPDGSNPYVRGDQISAAGEQRTFIIGADRKRTSVASVTLSQLIDLSGGNFDGIGVYRLGRDGAPVYVDESEPVYFYVEDGVVKWVITDGTDSNRVAEGNFGEGERIQLNGFEGEHAGVEIAVTPDTIRAGVEATFTATTSGGEDGEEFHYKWTLDGVAQDESNATFKKTFKKKASHVVGVEAIGSTGSRGYAEVGVNVARAPKQPQQNGGGGNGGTTTPGGGAAVARRRGRPRPLCRHRLHRRRRWLRRRPARRRRTRDAGPTWTRRRPPRVLRSPIGSRGSSSARACPRSRGRTALDRRRRRISGRRRTRTAVSTGPWRVASL